MSSPALGTVAVGGVAPARLQPPSGVLEVPEETGDGGERLEFGGVAPGRVAGQQAARDANEGLRLLHVPQLDQVLRVGLPLALDKDLVSSLDVVQGGAVTVVAGCADEPERHVALRLRWWEIQDECVVSGSLENCGRLRLLNAGLQLRASNSGEQATRDPSGAVSPWCHASRHL